MATATISTYLRMRPTAEARGLVFIFIYEMHVFVERTEASCGRFARRTNPSAILDANQDFVHIIDALIYIRHNAVLQATSDFEVTADEPDIIKVRAST